MSDIDVRDNLERQMADEPPHRSLPDLVRAGEQRLRRRRFGYGAGALAVLGVIGLGASVLPHDASAARDGSGVADTASAAPSLAPTPDPTGDPEMGQTLAPGKLASYSYQSGPGCGGQFVGCDRYQFESKAIRDSVVAAIEFRLIDGTSKKVETHHGRYDVRMSGSLPPGYQFVDGRGMVDPQGDDADMFAGLTLYAADGSVLATATSTNSDQLDAYPEYCDLLAKDEPCVRP